MEGNNIPPNPSESFDKYWWKLNIFFNAFLSFFFFSIIYMWIYCLSAKKMQVLYNERCSEDYNKDDL